MRLPTDGTRETRTSDKAAPDRRDWRVSPSPTTSKAGSPRRENPYRRVLLRQARSVNTRSTIVRAATRLWTKKGYADTTVEDICAAAKVVRSTFYQHFDSKDSLLTEIALTTALGVAGDVEGTLGNGTLDDNLAAFVDGLVRRIEGTPRSLVVMVMRQVFIRAPANRDQRSEHILFDDVLAAIIEDGQARGEIVGDVDPGDVGEVLAGMVLDALQRWTAEDSDRTLREALELRFDLLLRQLRTVKPARRKAGKG
jgi:AcrR family transcriptional regulator